LFFTEFTSVDISEGKLIRNGLPTSGGCLLPILGGLLIVAAAVIMLVSRQSTPMFRNMIRQKFSCAPQRFKLLLAFTESQVKLFRIADSRHDDFDGLPVA